MADVLDYIVWRGDLSFEVAPINEVDLFLCTQTAMADLEGTVSEAGTVISVADAAKKYFAEHNPDMKKPGALQSDKLLPAFRAMGKSKRYGTVGMSHHTDCVCTENNEQFSATVFRFSPNVFAVVFRGTDDTLIGWKEDCNLAIYDEVPAQKDALDYLQRAAEECEGKIIVAGHSKGGNLAVYASSNTKREIQDRIIQVFNFDGPGFSGKFINENRGYARIRDRILTVVSQNSIIGMLLEVPGRVAYVRSMSEGLRAHDGFSWEVEVNHFKRVGGLSRFSRLFDEVFTKVINKMTAEEKEKFVDELFGILFESGADTITEFKNIGWKASVGTVNKMTGSKAIREFFSTFLAAAMSKNGKDQ